MKDIFIEAIRNCKLIELTFRDSDDNIKTRICVPFDYAPSSRAKDKSDKYHFWDIDSPDGSHNLSLLPSSIITITALEQNFEPSQYVTWASIKWYISRDWGSYS